MGDLLAGQRGYRVCWRYDQPYIEAGIVCLRGNRQRWVRTDDGKWEKAWLFEIGFAAAITRELDSICGHSHWYGDHHTPFVYSHDPYENAGVIFLKVARLNRLLRRLHRYRFGGSPVLRNATTS